MSAKLFLHTALCLSLAAVLAWHVWVGHRRVVLSLMLAAVLWLGAGPFAYAYWPRGPFPRVTINWAQVAFLAVSLVVFTPSAAARRSSILRDEWDESRPQTLH